MNLGTDVTRRQSSFFGKFGKLCVLVTSALWFAPLPYYRRFVMLLLTTSISFWSIRKKISIVNNSVLYFTWIQKIRSIRWVVGNKAKGQISKLVFQENKAHQIFRKINISYPLIRTPTCAYQGVNVLFFGKSAVLCFLETPVLRFTLLPYYRRGLPFKGANTCTKSIIKRFLKYVSTGKGRSIETYYRNDEIW